MKLNKSSIKIVHSLIKLARAEKEIAIKHRANKEKLDAPFNK